jgi:hypothetical protein
MLVAERREWIGNGLMEECLINIGLVNFSFSND